ncbi:hypothetical protein [Psychromonas sp.]|uniref:hypothetical protein n=1 Tax=Psychromonas sp. TaxID=1884585 RepID=UPI003565D6BD
MKKRLKRFFILLTGLSLLFFISLMVFIRFFDINQYANWISRQISESSGYQISFQSIDQDLVDNGGFSVNGISLFIEQAEVLQIAQLRVKIKSIDLWNRELEIAEIEISSPNIELDQSGLNTLMAAEKGDSAADKDKLKITVLPWQKLHINQLRVVDLNAEIHQAGHKIQLQQADLKVNNLNIITDNQVQADLLQGRLAALIQGIELDLADLPKLNISDSQLDLSIDKNAVVVERLDAYVFAGQLRLQAQVLLTFDPTVSTLPAVKSVTIDSLLLKDMNLLIPPAENFPTAAQSGQNTQPLMLPLETLFIKQAQTENLNIRSDNSRIPLTVNKLSGSVQAFYVIQNNQLTDLYGDSNQDALFAIRFALLRWWDSEMEGFAATGSLNQDNPSLLLLQEHFKTP